MRLVFLCHNDWYMRKPILVFMIVLIVVILVSGFFVGEFLLFKGKVKAALKSSSSGNSFANVAFFPETKFLRGVFLGFEKGSEKIGDYEFIHKAVFAGIDKKGNLFFFREPLVLKANEESFYRPAQFWESKGRGLDGYNSILQNWRELKPGKTYAFMISADVDKFFPQYDGGNVLFFESKTLEKVYLITKQYVERHGNDLKTVYSEVTSPWRVYDIIEMTKGEIDMGEAVRLPGVIRIKYLTDLPNAKI